MVCFVIEAVLSGGTVIEAKSEEWCSSHGRFILKIGSNHVKTLSSMPVAALRLCSHSFCC